MIKLVVVDRSAESRAGLVDWINGFLRADNPELAFLPRISIKPLSPEELKFHGAPDLCIVGSELLSRELTEVASIKRMLPDTPVIARADASLAGLSAVEQLVRLGADDVIGADISAAEFTRKIIILSRRRAKARNGKLVLVQSGKGGLGVTSLAAGLGECLLEHGRKVALLDFDFETQDLSRFLQARPYVNENLQLLFEHSRPITQEAVEQCLVPVWSDESGLVCMPPPAETDSVYDSQASYARTLLSILEVLDALFDCVVVDGGSARGAFLKTLLRVADKAVFIINNDPAALYASVDKLSHLRMQMSAGADLLLVGNALSRTGLADRLLHDEFNRAAKLDESAWAKHSLPYSRSASRWPGSGSTIFGQGGSGAKKALAGLSEELGLIDPPSRSAATEEPRPQRSLGAALGGWFGKRAPSEPLLALAAKPERQALPVPALMAGSDSGSERLCIGCDSLPQLEASPLVSKASFDQSKVRAVN